MLARRTRLRLRAAIRAATLWLLVLSYSAAALGMPLPMPTVVDPQGTPFPCQSHRCGCRTAEQCWKSCCCLSNREKLAWARAHDLTPPGYVITAALQESTLCATRSCCSKHTAPSTTTPELESAVGIVWVSAADAGRCRGDLPIWQNLPPSLPATAPQARPSFDFYARQAAMPSAVEPYCPSFAPPDPPPRRG